LCGGAKRSRLVFLFTTLIHFFVESTCSGHAHEQVRESSERMKDSSQEELLIKLQDFTGQTAEERAKERQRAWSGSSSSRRNSLSNNTPPRTQSPRTSFGAPDTTDVVPCIEKLIGEMRDLRVAQQLTMQEILEMNNRVISLESSRNSNTSTDTGNSRCCGGCNLQ
jgi:hypothetical protein